MHDVDFLPAEYRQHRARRRVQPWRMAVVVAFLALVAAAASSQLHRRRQLQSDLAALAPQREVIEEQNAQLAGMQAALGEARARAELITYLRHPWPKTQVLDSLLAPMPGEIALERLEVFSEPAGPEPAAGRPSAVERKAEQQAAAKLPPAGLDLQRLRGECDRSRTVVALAGVTSDGAALHRYLGELGRTYLFSKVELRSIEAETPAGGERLRFEAMLIVRPGYGQPGGPEGPADEADKVAVARSAREVP
jgi:hypothetical protein